MKLTDTLFLDFDRETANTRKTLERVPEDKVGWKPHPKSPTMGWLGAHLANIPQWVVIMLENDSLDVGAGPQREPPQTPRQILESFDGNVKAARSALDKVEDAHLLAPWTLLSNGQQVFTMPRTAVLRNFVMNHMVHHRAQLAVYLRLNDVAVPALYGPSADESGMS